MSDDTLPVDHADDDLGADDLDGTAPFVADVRVQGAVRVQDIAVDWPVSRSETLPTTATLVVPGNPRRSRAVLVSNAEDFYVGPTSASVDQGVAAIWPAGLPLELRGRRPVYVKAYGSTASILSVLVEELA
jgi:hypothetical protein